jgi:pentapeptide MXKDX repeat protein
MVRLFAMLAVSLSLLLGLTGTHYLFAQDELKKADAKKDEAKKDETKKDEAKKEEPKKDETKKDEAKKEEPKKEEPLPPITPEVQAKLDAARKAVAELIVAAQDAGLVKTSIKDPPPILDLLITGRAVDERDLKAKTGVSPEVFGAWFTGYGKTEGVTPQNDVRIVNPSGGLKTWYDQRASIFNTQVEAIRKAKGTPAPKEETKKAEPKKDEPKKAEPKKDEPKKAEPKKDEPKSDKKDEKK